MNNGCYIPRGKMLGGSSSMNWMLYVRGNQGDFDYWSDLGNCGWDSATAWKYFKKSENNTYPPFVAANNGADHSDQGPMKVSFCGFTPPYEQIYVAACNEKGIPFNPDINGDNHHGVTDLQGTLYQGRRESVVKAFLIPAMDRPNLTVVKKAFVEKVIFNQQNEAIGVVYNYNGTTHRTVYARKEVILSAGAIMSPVILMHSGIGPTDQLKKYNIQQRVNSPVGKTLYDHVASQLIVTFDPTPPLPPTFPLDEFYDWAIHSSGPLTAMQQQWAFLSTNSSRPLNRPDTQVTFYYFETNSTNMIVFLQTLNIRAEIIAQAALINQFKNVGFIIPYLLQPQSEGYLKLNGASVYDKPLINLNFFGNNEDLELMVSAIEDQIDLIGTAAFQSLGAELLHVPLPECDPLPYLSREYLKCYVSYLSGTAYHQCGTCRMGSLSDPTAVVDARLRVYQVKRLRVVDASV